MHLTKPQFTAHLGAHRFSELFIQLGWDKENLPTEPLRLTLNDGRHFTIHRVAEKRGFPVCVCDVGSDYPEDKATRLKLTRQLARNHYEHLLILYGDGKQCWSVVIRPQNRPLRTVEVEWYEQQDSQRLLEKLHGTVFDISEEERLGITDVVQKVRDAFMDGSEHATKAFYTEFRTTQLKQFSMFIDGIREQIPRDWYAALMINRLMFIYFIQKKGFLDNDRDYLRNHLIRTKNEYGSDEFHGRFYRHFLRLLFADGLATPQQQRDPQLQKMIGRVPYLNSGLFDLHSIEKDHSDIDIKDQAFEDLFGFFDKWNWRLDNSPTASGRDINPDVIGHIFEKYINDRVAMGAYYTQEDITGYIARNTIIPFLLHRTREKCANAFRLDTGIWRFLRDNPAGYIHQAVRHGCDVVDGDIPESILRGMDSAAPDLLAQREHWNTPTEEEFALPTEIWRETMARRQHYFALIEKLQNGKIHEIDELITHNLDIERFASDAVRDYEGSDFIAAFYEAIAGRKPLNGDREALRGITVLDPACGSGAFLFAALNILESLYEGCIDRMREFVHEDDELRRQGKRKGAKKHLQFREILDDIDKHGNQKYWIYKTIILHNLYGVDFMPEAAEIAKLRLFLKLAAEAEYDPDREDLGLEPLPDIDFNIRTGNSLVGFASMEDFRRMVAVDVRTGQARMNLSDITERVREQAISVQQAGEHFRQTQDHGYDDYREAKIDLGKRFGELNEEMNRYLAEQYSKTKDTDYSQWQLSHKPFHWATEFYGVIKGEGGFDVVIGNPPYVEYSKVQKGYTVKDYQTESCGNLYAFFVERNRVLLSKAGWESMIVPHSAFCTDRMSSLIDTLDTEKKTWISSYAIRPAKLFSDAEQRLSIYIRSPDKGEIESSKYTLWHAKYRNHLLQSLRYQAVKKPDFNFIPKCGDKIGIGILDKIKLHSGFGLPRSASSTCVYFHNAPGYWIRAMDFIPYFRNDQDGERQSTQIKNLYLTDNSHRVLYCALLNSSLFYWWFIVCSDCRHLNSREIINFPFHPDRVSPDHHKRLSVLIGDLMADYRHHAVRKEARYKATGTVVYDEFFPGKSKSIIDEIDKIFAAHYALTEEETDYIINYDIKYRMGLKGG